MSDWDSQLERINHLLSFQPLKKDSNASSPIVNPILPIAQSLKAGQFRPSFKGKLGALEVQGTWGYYDFLHLNEEPLKDVIIHVYSPTCRSDIPSVENATIVLHSHAGDEYCPYRAGCHTYPCWYTKFDLPKFFLSIWEDFYGDDFWDAQENNPKRSGGRNQERSERPTGNPVFFTFGKDT